MSNNWIYKKKAFKKNEGYFGFIYLIIFHGKYLKDKSNLEYPIGSIYVGKKCFTYAKRTKLSKKAKLLPENKGKRILHSTKDSGWQDYYGSSKGLIAFIGKVGKENFSREILHFTTSKAENTYMELKEQILRKVLEVPSFNLWISGKIWKHQLKSK